MKEGYYLSIFTCINEVQNHFDVKLRHDHAIALWQLTSVELKLIRYWELERISGIKQHPKALFNTVKANQLITYLLSTEGLTLDDIEGIWGTKELETDSNYQEIFNNNIAFHSIAHLLTSIYFGNSNPFSDMILGMALDGGPDSQFEENVKEKYYYAGCVIRNNQIDVFPIESPAQLWSYSRKKFNLREGTLMALGSAMETECYISEDKMLEWSNLQFYDEAARYNAQSIVENICEYIFEITEQDIGEKCSKFDNRFDDFENRVSMVIKVIMELSIRMISRNIEKICVDYQIETENAILALSGGFALSCPCNSAILQKYHFRNYQIPPCTNDSGIALGIGLAAFYNTIKENHIKTEITSAYYGQSIKPIKAIHEEYKDYILEIKDSLIEECTEMLINGKILIWLNENAEIGPRALGNRSLLADPRYIDSKNRLNEIKKRQWWRPVAPVIMHEYGNEYFENYRFSPNMLLNMQVNEEKLNEIPAVIHHDKTARVQSVTKETNKTLYDLLENFKEKTGVPILCNTSLNDAGEPIINTIEEAIEFALHKGLDTIVVNGKHMIKIKVQHELLGLKPKLRKEEFFESDKKFDFNKMNRYGLNNDELTIFYDNPKEFKGINIESEEAKTLSNEKLMEFKKNYPLGFQR